MLPPTSSEPFEDIITEWKKTLTANEKDPAAFFASDKFEARVKNCSRSIFEYYQKLAKKPVLEILQMVFQ